MAKVGYFSKSPGATLLEAVAEREMWRSAFEIARMMLEDRHAACLREDSGPHKVLTLALYR